MTDAVVESHVAAGGAGAAGGVVLLAGAAKLWGHLTSDELSKGQVALMEHIKQCHAATILDSIRDTPPEFSTAEGVPALRMTSQRFAVEYWCGRGAGEGAVRPGRTFKASGEAPQPDPPPPPNGEY